MSTSVFLAYVHEDRAPARRLALSLRRAGFAPWLYEDDLLPGENWPRAIEGAIDRCRFFVACFSRHSVTKRGHFQYEVAYAIEAAKRLPPDGIYVLPLRFDACTLPSEIARKLHHADLFPDWHRGTHRLIRAMRVHSSSSNPRISVSSLRRSR